MFGRTIHFTMEILIMELSMDMDSGKKGTEKFKIRFKDFFIKIKSTDLEFINGQVEINIKDNLIMI